LRHCSFTDFLYISVLHPSHSQSRLCIIIHLPLPPLFFPVSGWSTAVLLLQTFSLHYLKVKIFVSLPMCFMAGKNPGNIASRTECCGSPEQGSHETGNVLGKPRRLGSLSEQHHAVSTAFFSSTYQHMQDKGTDINTGAEG
jgi:hypothetical protein